MEPVSLLFALGQLAAPLLRFVGRDKAAEVAERGLAAARTLTGKEDPQAAIDALKANPELAARFAQMANEIVLAELEAETRRLEAVNATMRAELQSPDPYVRRARPTFLYVIAGTWAVQTLAFGVAIVWKPAHAASLLGAMNDLAFMWAIALSVVGVYVKVRSDDKKTAAGEAAPTALESIAGLVRRK